MASTQTLEFLNSNQYPNPLVFPTLIFAITLPIVLLSWPRLIRPFLRRLVRSSLCAPDVLKMVRSHQENAIRLPLVEEVRTIIDSRVRGMFSLLSQKSEGYPSASMVDYACDEDGCPIITVSSLTVFSKDIFANPKCSLVVAKDPEDMTDLVVAKDPEDMTDLVATLHGVVVQVEEKDKEAVRAAYLKKHPSASKVDSGDLVFVRIEPTAVSYASGDAAAIPVSGVFSKEEYAVAKPDPIAQFSKPVASHMNKDHEEDTKLIVRQSTSIPVDSAYMLDLDSLGFNVKASYQKNSFKLRIPFPRRAKDRKDVKTLIVEMLQTAQNFRS